MVGKYSTNATQHMIVKYRKVMKYTPTPVPNSDNSLYVVYHDEYSVVDDDDKDGGGEEVEKEGEDMEKSSFCVVSP